MYVQKDIVTQLLCLGVDSWYYLWWQCVRSLAVGDYFLRAILTEPCHPFQHDLEPSSAYSSDFEVSTASLIFFDKSSLSTMVTLLLVVTEIFRRNFKKELHCLICLCDFNTFQYNVSKQAPSACWDLQGRWCLNVFLIQWLVFVNETLIRNFIKCLWEI